MSFTVNKDRCMRCSVFLFCNESIFFIYRLILITLIMRSFPILKMLLAMRLLWVQEMSSTSPCIGKRDFCMAFL